MILGKVKYGKIAIVIFLTVLIWVWVDLALDEEFTVPKATINVAFKPNLLVSFDDEPKATIDNIVLKGPASKVAEVRRKLNDGSLVLDFFLDPEREGMTTAGPHTLTVLDFIKRSEKMKELSGLTVEACEPEMLNVSVVGLVKKAVDIECFDESGAPLAVASIEPLKVDMFVPADSRLKAQVQLTRGEIDQARLSAVVETPYIVLATDQKRQASTPVKIKMPPEADSLIEYPITEAKLGIVLSVNLQGEYAVDVTNHNDVVRAFTILATLEAKQAYENQLFQMFLYIRDDDAKKGTEQEPRRKVVYNFPEEFVREGEIRLKNPQQPAEARFKLIPLTSAPAPPAGVD
ncbi:MAG: hypothetical protein WAV28_19455 [Sedimentisphaerales bacterium]|jgi:hypothetical protein